MLCVLSFNSDHVNINDKSHRTVTMVACLYCGCWGKSRCSRPGTPVRLRAVAAAASHLLVPLPPTPQVLSAPRGGKERESVRSVRETDEGWSRLEKFPEGARIQQEFCMRGTNFDKWFR